MACKKRKSVWRICFLYHLKFTHFGMLRMFVTLAQGNFTMVSCFTSESFFHFRYKYTHHERFCSGKLDIWRKLYLPITYAKVGPILYFIPIPTKQAFRNRYLKIGVILKQIMFQIYTDIKKRYISSSIAMNFECTSRYYHLKTKF